MRNPLRAVAAFAAGFGLASHAPLSIAQISDAAISGGRIEGVIADGVAAFKGVPFAAAPVGPLRWKAPQPVKPWQGVRKADTFGPSCMQDAGMVRMLAAPPA